jgi:hypothetical protein
MAATFVPQEQGQGISTLVQLMSQIQQQKLQSEMFDLQVQKFGLEKQTSLKQQEHQQVLIDTAKITMGKTGDLLQSEIDQRKAGAAASGAQTNYYDTMTNLAPEESYSKLEELGARTAKTRQETDEAKKNAPLVNQLLQNNVDSLASTIKINERNSLLSMAAVFSTSPEVIEGFRTNPAFKEINFPAIEEAAKNPAFAKTIVDFNLRDMKGLYDKAKGDPVQLQRVRVLAANMEKALTIPGGVPGQPPPSSERQAQEMTSVASAIDRKRTKAGGTVQGGTPTFSQSFEQSFQGKPSNTEPPSTNAFTNYEHHVDLHSFELSQASPTINGKTGPRIELKTPAITESVDKRFQKQLVNVVQQMPIDSSSGFRINERGELQRKEKLLSNLDETQVKAVEAASVPDPTISVKRHGRYLVLLNELAKIAGAGGTNQEIEDNMVSEIENYNALYPGATTTRQNQAIVAFRKAVMPGVVTTSGTQTATQR